MASSSGVGTLIGVTSPFFRSFAIVRASRLSALMRSEVNRGHLSWSNHQALNPHPLQHPRELETHAARFVCRNDRSPLLKANCTLAIVTPVQP